MMFNKCQWLKGIVDGEDEKVEEKYDKWSAKQPQDAYKPENRVGYSWWSWAFYPGNFILKDKGENS